MSDQEYLITYLKKTSILKRVFGITLFALGFFMFFRSNIFFGAILLGFGVHLNLIDGSQIDLQTKKYRTVKTFFGWYFGKWKPCPEFEYVSVFKTKETQRINGVAASTNVSSEIILVNLFYDTNKRETFYKTEDKEEAFKVAEHFKLALGIDILDATEVESKWL